MWKASFTSVLAIKKKPPLREFDITKLEGLLEAGVTIGVAASSSYEGNFREATSGPFKTAWNIMKNNNKSFVKNRKEALPRLLEDDQFSFFDSLTAMSGTKEYQSCQVSPIIAK